MKNIYFFHDLQSKATEFGKAIKQRFDLQKCCQIFGNIAISKFVNFFMIMTLA